MLARTLLNKFLSTPSARRATGVVRTVGRNKRISIHALREEGDCFLYGFLHGGEPISIHALREEGDKKHPASGLDAKISIHALREEGDIVPDGFVHIIDDFYPRSPRGGRRLYPVSPEYW